MSQCYLRDDDKKAESKEKGWNERFILDKIPPYDAYRDNNYISLGLMKSKIRFEHSLEKENEKKKLSKSKKYSQHYAINSLDRKPPNQTLNTNRDFQPQLKIKLFQFSNTLNSDKKFTNKKNIDFSKTYSNNFNQLQKSAEKQNNVEDEINKEFLTLKQLWDNFGVSIAYQKGFVNNINSFKKIEDIKQFITLEKNQMNKFKSELICVLKKIIQRNDEIEKLKKLLHSYVKVRNIENIEKLEADIEESIISIRFNTVNVVSKLKNFFISNSFLLFSGKVNLNKIKNDYHFNEMYILSIKNDFDFLINYPINNIFDMENFSVGDPFLLSISEYPNEKNNNYNNNNKPKKLKLNSNLLFEIQNCLFFMNQMELINKMKDVKPLNKNSPQNKSPNDYGIGLNFKGNLSKRICQLKYEGNYNKLFYNTNNNNSMNDNYNFYNCLDKNLKTSISKKNKELQDIPVMTSEQINGKFKEYKKIADLMKDYENEEKNINENKQKKEEKIMKEKEKENKKKKKDEEDNKKLEEERRKKEGNRIIKEKRNEEKRQKEEEERKKLEYEENQRKLEKEKIRKEKEKKEKFEKERLDKENRERLEKEENERLEKEEREKLEKEKEERSNKEKLDEKKEKERLEREEREESEEREEKEKVQKIISEDENNKIVNTTDKNEKQTISENIEHNKIVDTPFEELVQIQKVDEDNKEKNKEKL